MSSNAQLLERRTRNVPRGVGTALEVFAARARNAELWDVEGRRFVDFAAGIAVLNVGHCHPKVMAAVAGQLDKVTHAAFQVTGYGNYVELAERLNRIAPVQGAAKTILFSTGAEALENTIKIARVATRRQAVIAFSGGFHGRSFMAMSLTGKTLPYKRGFGPLPGGVYHVPFPAPHKGVSVADSLAAIEGVFKADVAPEEVAAIVIEPVQGEGGFLPAPPELLRALRELCDRHGIVLVADEVQTGFARTGRMFGIEHSGVRADLVTVAKALGGGFPLSGVVGRAELMDSVEPGGLGGTYAGSPVACAAALAVLDVIEEEGLVERARVLGAKVAERLARMAADPALCPIGNLRGPGSMIAFDLLAERGGSAVDPAATKAVLQRAHAAGLILLGCGAQGEAIRLLYPLTIEDAVLEEGLDLLEAALRPPAAADIAPAPRRIPALRGKGAILAVHALPTLPMKRESRAADGLNLALDPSAPLSLQHQLRQKLVDAIHRRVLRPGQRLPSSRQLAIRLGVSRNTVSLAYDTLLAEGHLASRSRSGIYVAADVPGTRAGRGTRGASQASPLMARLPAAADDGDFRCPQHWHRYPFPFVDGRVDAELAPVAEWSEAIRLAGSRHEVVEWPQQAGDADDAMLVEEMRGKVLPMRGIEAGADEVLVTLSSRHALRIVGELLARRGVPVLLEQPVDVALERALRERGADVGYLPPELERPFPENVVVVTSGRHGFAADSSYPRRLLAHVVAANGLLVEHDIPAGVQDGERVAPALRGFDRDGRVVYVGGLAPVASCGEPPGVLVAAPAFIERARALRRGQGCTPPRILQRAWAYYIGLGHYSASLVRAGRLLAERRTALRDALNHYLHDQVRIETFAGASAYWVSLRDGQDPWELARRATAVGVLVEPVRRADGSGALCMGVTGIAASGIREGVRHLARLVRGERPGGPRRIGVDGVVALAARQLRQALAGSTMLYSTVYGEPCTIEIRANGELVGTAGYSGEDCDQGHWWVEGDRWYRQWRQWAYGEAAGYRVALDGDQVGVYGEDGFMVDTMVRVRPARPKRRG